LFYRLNVFQIKVPSLTERKNDILRLTKYYLDKWGEHRNLTKDLRDFLNNYNWPGNVRELINTIKYMITVEENELSFINLPDYLKTETNTPKTEILLLKRLYWLNEKDENTGRRSLKKDFTHNYYDISEVEIRKLLHKLAEKEMVQITKGRAGTSITNYGLKYLKENEYIF